MATRLDRDQPNVDFNCRYRNTSIAVRAVQICVCTAFALVPRNVLIFRFCFIALKKSSSELGSFEMDDLGVLREISKSVAKLIHELIENEVDREENKLR